MAPNDTALPVGLISLGPWKIDIEGYRVYGPDGGTSGLSARTDDLLLLLCRHPNQIVTREQILATVWADRVVEDAAVSNCVWQIRKALGERGKDILQTRARRGYLLAIPEHSESEAPVINVHTAAPLPLPDFTSDEPSRPHVSEILPASIPSAAPPSRRSRRGLLLSALLLVFAALAALFWTIRRDPLSGRITLGPDATITASIVLPEKLDWMRKAVLHSAVEQAYLRGSSVLLFEDRQQRNPFADPHLQVIVLSGNQDRIDAELSIDHDRGQFSERYRGPPEGLDEAIGDLMIRTLPPAMRKPSPAVDTLVSGLVSELRYDYQSALIDYRSAVAGNPSLVEARIAIARALSELNRGREALDSVDSLLGEHPLDAAQRCELDLLLITLARDRIARPACAHVDDSLKLMELDARETVRRLQSDSNKRYGARTWRERQYHYIIALTIAGEWQQAESEITRTVRIATEAGWRGVAIYADSLRALVAAERGDIGVASKIRMRAADRMEATGDIDTALYLRTSA
jgi:DNA-binding winged helix-turn-helix (wHTH) protein/tetratricopeptide (TPR) repeat protein